MTSTTQDKQEKTFSNQGKYIRTSTNQDIQDRASDNQNKPVSVISFNTLCVCSVY